MIDRASGNPVIEAVGLRKTFRGGVNALNGLDLRVDRGSVYAFLGRNGSGKTTGLRILLGLLEADEGSTRVLGRGLMHAPPSHRQRVAYVCQTQQLHAWMTLRELCHYVSHFYDTWQEDGARRLARRFDLPLDRPVGHLSGGEQKKAANLLALATGAEVLVLDEPAAGLDPLARRQLIDELVDFLAQDGGRTIVFATHIVSDVERLATHVGFLDGGRLVDSGTVDDFQQRLQRVQIIFDGDRIPDGFELAGAVRTEASGAVLSGVVKVLSDTQLDYVGREFGARVQTFPLGLEDVFVEVLGGDADAARGTATEEGLS